MLARAVVPRAVVNSGAVKLLAYAVSALENRRSRSQRAQLFLSAGAASELLSPPAPAAAADEDSDDEETKALIEESRRELLMAIGKSPGARAGRGKKGK